MQDQYDLFGYLSAPVDIEEVTIIEFDLFIDKVEELEAKRALLKAKVDVINELKNSVTLFDYAAVSGMLTKRQTISTLPDDFDGTSYCADVKITPDGRFLYGTNRGHDSIAAFRINGDTGKLTPLGQTSSGGKSPRNFTIDPSGRYLLAALLEKIGLGTG